MLYTIRKNQKGLMIVVAVLTIFAFAWLYSPSDIADFGSNISAKVYGKSLTKADVDRQVRSYQLAIALGQLDLVGGLGGMSGNEEADVSEYVWNTLVLRHEAAALGIEPTTEQVAERVRTLPAFQTDGNFDPKKFETFTAGQLGPRGMTTLTLEEVIRDALRFEKVKALVASPAALEASETQRALRFFQKADLTVLKFPLEPVLAEITVTEEEARTYHSQNARQFVAPESITVESVTFSLPADQKALEGREKVAALQEVAARAAAFAELATPENFVSSAKDAGVEVKNTPSFHRSIATFASGLPPAVAQGAFLLTD
ncbi:MAG: SurA N-terminal domain-containing protein [Terrimicrobiaceae bacterium]